MSTLDLPTMATNLHDAACGCGDQLTGTWSTYWQNIARAAITVLVQHIVAGDLAELSSDDRRRVLRWLEQAR